MQNVGALGNLWATAWRQSRSTLHCLLAPVTIAALVIQPRPALAGIFDSTFHVDAQVGLDDPTRRLIEQFPKEMHDQLLDLLAKALPLIKTDVNEYLARINEIIDSQINHAQCAGNGLAKNIIDQITRSAGISSTPISDLRKNWDKTVNSIGFSSPPARYADRYGDLAYQAALTYCQVEIAPGLKDKARTFQEDARRRDVIWSRLDGQCSNPEDCLTKLVDETASLLNTSDARDVEIVRGRKRFGKIHKPRRPGYWAREYGSFDPRPYEDRLAELFRIGDGVFLAKAEREHTASALISAAKERIATARSEIAVAQRTLAPIVKFLAVPFRIRQVIVEVTPDMITNARVVAGSVESLCQRIDSDLTQAVVLDASLKVAADELRTVLPGLRNDVVAVRTAQAYRKIL